MPCGHHGPQQVFSVLSNPSGATSSDAPRHPQLRYPADGPDAVEGGVYVLNETLRKADLEAEFGGFGQYHKNRY